MLSFVKVVLWENRVESYFLLGSFGELECFGLIYVDLCGFMYIEFFSGNRYFLLFIDDYSRMSWVYFLKFKFEVFENFKKFKVLVGK